MCDVGVCVRGVCDTGARVGYVCVVCLYVVSMVCGVSVFCVCACVWHICVCVVCGVIVE